MSELGDALTRLIDAGEQWLIDVREGRSVLADNDDDALRRPLERVVACDDEAACSLARSVVAELRLSAQQHQPDLHAEHVLRAERFLSQLAAMV